MRNRDRPLLVLMGLGKPATWTALLRELAEFPKTKAIQGQWHGHPRRQIRADLALPMVRMSCYDTSLEASPLQKQSKIAALKTYTI